MDIELPFSLEDYSERFAAWKAKWAFNARARAAMYEDLAAFVAAGMPPFTAVSGILEVHELRGNPMAAMTREWAQGMEKGRGLADVMAPWADPAEVAMIGAGERSGKLEQALREAARLTRERHDMMSHAKRKLTMPVLQLLTLFGLVYYISSTIVPTARRLLPEQYMPGFAKAYFDFGDFVIGWGPWIILVAIAGLTLIFGTMQTWTGKRREWCDNRFPWTLFRALQSSFFLITVSAMMRSGMPMPQSLPELERFARPWMKEHIQRMMERLEKGNREPVAMDTGLLLDNMSDRLLIYSRLPDFTVVMENLGRDAIEGLKTSVDTMTGRINLAVMLAIAAFILATIFALGETSFAISDAVESRSRGI